MRENLIQDDGDEEHQLTDENLISFKNIIYVPNNDELKRIVMRYFHLEPYLGHLWYQNILTAIKRLYYWPNLKK